MIRKQENYIWGRNSSLIDTSDNAIHAGELKPTCGRSILQAATSDIIAYPLILKEIQMKKFMSMLVLLCFVAAPGFAQGAKPEKAAGKDVSKWHGYVVDAMCAKAMAKKDNPMERAAKHTRDCALEESCASTGYGLFYDGKYYKFDDEGDKKAKDVIEKSSTEKGLMVDVTGTMEGDKILKSRQSPR